MSHLVNAPLIVTVRSGRPDDRRYVSASWAEGFKETSGKMRDLPWAVYRKAVGPELEAVLDRADTRVLVAVVDHAPDICGWIAFSRLYRTPTVHWIHTRYRIGRAGEEMRRRGVMMALISAAELGPRWVYTHRGPRSVDLQLIRELHKRGITAAFVPMKEWAA